MPPRKGYWRRELDVRVTNGAQLSADEIEHALEALPPEQAEVVWLKLAGKSGKAIADQLRITPSAVSQRLARARENLPGMIVRLMDSRASKRYNS